MPLPVLPKALYPLVPSAPGVPAILRSGAAILDTLTLNQLGIGAALDSLLGTSASRWGVFAADGSPVALAESVVAIEYENTSKVSNYPIEGGKFSSYNKVADPYSVWLRMACGKSLDDRIDFINNIESASRSLDLFTVVTPEVVYTNANIVAVGYRRDSSEGANKIVFDIRITEVRQVAAAAFSNTKADSGNSPASLGQLQPIPDVTFDASEFV